VLHRYVIVRQEDGSDCGAAALATIALHYRWPIRILELRDLVGTDRGGTSLLSMMRAAEILGFSARGARGSYESLFRVPLPAVAHLRNVDGSGHFVVIHRVRRDSVVLANPARGIEAVSREQFCRLWTNHLLLIVPGHADRGTKRDAVPVSPLWRFARLMAPHRTVLVEAFICAIVMTVLGVSTSYFIRHLVDSVLAHNDGRLLNALGIGMVLVILFRALFGVARDYLVAHVGRKVDLALVARYARHLQGLPMQFFETRQVGEIISRITDTYKVRDTVSGVTLTTVVDGTLVSVLLAVLWSCDSWLALVATTLLPVLVVGVAAHHPAARERSRMAMVHGERLFAHLAENVCGVETFKAYGAEHSRADAGESWLVELTSSLFSLKKLGISMNTLGKLVTALAGTAILWYGGHRVMNEALTMGELIFFYTLLACLLEPLERLTSVNLQLQEALVAIDRLYQVMDMQVEELGDERKVVFRGVRDAIELHDVGFRYGSRGAVLGGLNLRIPAGRTVAIVGESGSGKSTILKLLMGFYVPTEGRITIDGLNMQDFGLRSLRSGIGLVSQDPFIFTGSAAARC
jgi:ATP-binding cassette, subfamily C, bacteriocin exporter